MIIEVVFSLLLLFSSLENISVEGTECLSNLTNLAVYEGDQNTRLNLFADPNNVQWTIIPTSDEFGSYPITDYGGTREATVSGLFYPNASGLVVLNATMNAYGGPISTAGLYIAQCADNGNRTGAKLVVIRKPVECSCNSSTPDAIQLSCTIVYADVTLSPIYASMTWTTDGVFFTSDTPQRKRTDTVFVSTSTVILDDSDPANFTCTVTFNAPTNIEYDFIATNAPVFSASCSVEVCNVETTTTTATTTTTTTTTQSPIDHPSTTTSSNCFQTIKNIAAYEGDLNTVMNLTADPNNVQWTVIPTSDEFGSYPITDYGGTRDESLSGLFYSNASGLVVLNATMNAYGGPISTAGLYTAQCADSNNKTAAKLVVIRKRPECSCNAGTADTVQLSCTFVYADVTLSPINANMAWTTDGVFYTTDTPQRTRTDDDVKVFVSTSTITVDNSVPSTFTCTVTFNAVTENEADYIATNAPDFSASCSVDVCGITTLSTPTTPPPATEPSNTTPTSYCYLNNMKNIAVREGTLNVLVHVTASHCAVTFWVLPTSDEFAGSEIVGPDCKVDPNLEALYYFDDTGLTIRNSTTTEDGNPMSTSGLYVADCNDNDNSTGAKLLVVRSGPTCSCVNDTSSSSVQLTCIVDYADDSIHPIPAIMTWFVNGENITTDSPLRNKTDMYVFTATSTITIDYVYADSYECLLTFGEPTDRTYDWIVTNAPEFSESCSTPCDYESDE